jgi:hypothetical protein
MVIVNLCDEESLGKTVRENDLNLEISEEFFGGETATIDEAISLMKTCHVANLVGNRIVRLAIDSELATPDAVRKVGETSFLMIYK